MNPTRRTVVACLSTLLLALSAVAVPTGVVGCAGGPGGSSLTGGSRVPVGSSCTVQFRRDALGGAADLPVSPLTSEINGATVSLDGTLLRADDEWVVIGRADDTLWVPRDAVLLLRFRKP